MRRSSAIAIALRTQVTMPALDAVGVSGSGEATFSEFESPSLRLSVTGSGSGTLTLGSGNLTGSISGAGEVRYRCSPARVDVLTSGSGRVVKDG